MGVWFAVIDGVGSKAFRTERPLLLLQARCYRKVPTLAFTMPSDDDSTSMGNWLAHLRSLFPSKPPSKKRAPAPMMA